jgi:thiamine-phosphate diphosphorylase/hydroxyethylthiazole kinase
VSLLTFFWSLRLMIMGRYNIPLIINDRVDIALAVGAAGVHVGQDDMPVEVVRKLLPADAIVGVSCHTIAHAQEAVKSGIVDYVGIGTIFDTATKASTDAKLIGPRRAAKIVQILQGTNVKSVAIGRSQNSARCERSLICRQVESSPPLHSGYYGVPYHRSITHSMAWLS